MKFPTNIKTVSLFAFIVISLFLMPGCEDKNTSPDETDLHLVTGIQKRNNNASNLEKLGNPNTFLDGIVNIYPNPAQYAIQINTSSNSNITNVWLVSANAQKIYQDVDFSTTLNSNLYSQSTIQSASVESSTFPNGQALTLDVSNVSVGYYRVFIKIDGQIYWDNLLIGDNIEEINSLLEVWN